MSATSSTDNIGRISASQSIESLHSLEEELLLLENKKPTEESLKFVYECMQIVIDDAKKSASGKSKAATNEGETPSKGKKRNKPRGSTTSVAQRTLTSSFDSPFPLSKRVIDLRQGSHD